MALLNENLGEPFAILDPHEATNQPGNLRLRPPCNDG